MPELTESEIRLILAAIGRETVVQSTSAFPFVVMTAAAWQGYHSDPKVGCLQAKLSIMLEATQR